MFFQATVTDALQDYCPPAPFCKNNEAVLGTTDDGCPTDGSAPNCDADSGKTGKSCFFCKADSTNPLVTPDSGCAVTAPNCDESTDPETCYFCKNDKSLGTTDNGCTADKPNCDAGNGATGTSCFFCKNDSDSGTDSGCTAPAKPNCDAVIGETGTECYGPEVCFDIKNFGVDALCVVNCGAGAGTNCKTVCDYFGIEYSSPNQCRDVGNVGGRVGNKYCKAKFPDNPPKRWNCCKCDKFNGNRKGNLFSN